MDFHVQCLRSLHQKFPFGTYQYRVIPLKRSLSLHAKHPRTGRISTTHLKIKASQGATIFADIHPLFVLAHGSRYVTDHRDRLQPALHDTLIRISLLWPAPPPREFYRNACAFKGQFGRSIPFFYRDEFVEPTPAPQSPHSVSTCSYSDSDSDRSSKRSRLSSDTEDEEGLDVGKWVSECKPTEFQSCVADDKVIGSYAVEISRSLEEVMETMANLSGRIVRTTNSPSPKRKRVAE